MQRRIIILALGVLAAGVIAGGLVIRAKHNAEAIHNNVIQPGDINDDGVINFPGDVIQTAKVAQHIIPAPTPIAHLDVTETNVDGGGNIKVHEQGRVNVNVVADTTGRLVDLGVVSFSDLYRSPLIDISDCRSVVSMANNEPGSGVGYLAQVALGWTSPDGAVYVRYTPPLRANSFTTQTSVSETAGTLALKWAALQLDAPTSNATTVAHVWLWCSRS